MIANAVWLLDDVELSDLEVWLWGRECEEKGAFGLNVSALTIGFCESDVGESSADFSATSLKTKKYFNFSFHQKI